MRGDLDRQPTAQLKFTPSELWELIERTVRAEVGPLVARLERQLETLDSSAQVTRLESRMETLDSRLVALDSRLNALDSRVYALDSRLNSKEDTLDARIDDLTTQMYRRSSEPSGTTTRQNSTLESIATEICQTQGAEWTAKLDRQKSQLEDLVERVNQGIVRLDDAASSQNRSLRPDEEDGDASGWRPRLDQLTGDLNAVTSRLDEVTDKAASYAPQLELLTAETDALRLKLRSIEAEFNTSRRETSALPPRDCSELPADAVSGIHLLRPGLDRSLPPVPAYCDMDTDGGGWTVIQRRDDIQPRQDFYLSWAAYREGFGELDAEFWWGLEHLWSTTGRRDRRYQLRVTIGDFDGQRRHALYGIFRVSSEQDGYRLTVGNYSGDAGDSLKRHNGLQFSTKDRDNDKKADASCATLHKGAWWYKDCFDSNLNGQALVGKNPRKGGMGWHFWKNWDYSFKSSEMKIRPV